MNVIKNYIRKIKDCSDKYMPKFHPKRKSECRKYAVLIFISRPKYNLFYTY